MQSDQESDPKPHLEALGAYPGGKYVHGSFKVSPGSLPPRGQGIYKTCMKAAVVDRYGPPEVVQIRVVPTPVAGAGRLLIRVVRATVTSGDARVRGFNLPRPIFWLPGRLALGVLRPRQKVLGTELSGIVEQVGAGVTRFREGDRVFAYAAFGKSGGAHAEFIVMDEDAAIEPVPAGFSMEEAACIGFGGTTALYYLEKLGKIKAGQRVMVVGASGAVGLASVSIAGHMGAQVTGVCSSKNAALVRQAGAVRVIDYTEEDCTDPAVTGGAFDLVFDVVGAHKAGAYKRVVDKGGLCLACVMGFDEIVRMIAGRLLGGPRVKAGVALESPEVLGRLRELAEAGGYRPVVDRVYPFAEIVEAYRYVDTWRKRGSVVLSVSDDQIG